MEEYQGYPPIRTRLGRTRNTEPQDLFNSLLNYGYGVLYTQVEQAILLAGLEGNSDLILIVPTEDGKGQEAIVVEYKHSEQKAGPHFKIQLAAYALLIEEQLHIPVRHGFLYSIPRRKAEKIMLTTALRHKVGTVIQEIRSTVASEQMPPPTKTLVVVPPVNSVDFAMTWY